MIAKGEQTLRYLVLILTISALGGALIFDIAACNNQTGFSGSVGNTPNGTPLASYNILGNPVGIPFTATVSDTRSSWTFQGNTNLSVFIVNNSLPAEIIATKLASDNSLLSVEIISGFHVANLQSTSAPGGTVSVQVGPTPLAAIAPHANPDLRISLLGPKNLRYQALVEDIGIGFVIDAHAPTLILFDMPSNKVDATFFGPNNFTLFTANMTLNNANGSVQQVLVKTFRAGPNLTIREP